MPTYCYNCPECGEFEHRQGSYKGKGDNTCPRCGAEDAYDFGATVQPDVARESVNCEGWEIHAPGGPFYYSSARDLDRQLANARPGLSVKHGARRQPFRNRSAINPPNEKQIHEACLNGGDK